MSEPDYLDGDKYIEDYLEIAKQKFEEGNKAVLLMAMHQCLLLRKPLPEWLRLAFIRAYEFATAFEIRSWMRHSVRRRRRCVYFKSGRSTPNCAIPVALSVALTRPQRNY